MSSLVDVDAAPIAWREAGTGPTIVFLHGLGGSRTAWDPQLGALSDRWRCVAWDMPGYGRSEAIEPLTFPAIADAVVGLLDTIGVERAHLCGLSFGGQQALHTAVRYPDRVASLVLADTSPAFGLDGTDPEQWKRARLDPLDEGLAPADFAEDVVTAVAGSEFGGPLKEQAVAAMARISATGLRAACECLVDHDLSGRLSEVAVPTLVIVGSLDQETPVAYSQALHDGIAGSTLVVIDGVGHLTPVEAPERFNQLVRRFLEPLDDLVERGTLRT